MADKNYKLTFALSDGTTKAVQFTAPQGATGATGQRGTGILKITTAPSSYTTATGGFTPTYRVSLSTVKTQSKVNEVLVGDVIQYSYYQYPIGYVDGSYVYTGARTSLRGSTGAAGAAGADGANGADGYTPVKGVDYFTPADQEAIVQQVIAALGTPVYGTVSEDKTIILEADLGAGTYTFMLKKDDGSLALIGTGEYQSGPKYTNALTEAIDTDGQPYNGGKGWKDGYRLNSSSTETADTAADITGFIPAKWGDTLYLENVKMNPNSANKSKSYIRMFNSSFTVLGAYFRGDTGFAHATTNGGMVVGSDGYASSIKLDATTFTSVPDSGMDKAIYVRFCCDEITDDSIVTVNEPIE